MFSFKISDHTKTNLKVSKHDLFKSNKSLKYYCSYSAVALAGTPFQDLGDSSDNHCTDFRILKKFHMIYRVIPNKIITSIFVFYVLMQRKIQLLLIILYGLTCMYYHVYTRNINSESRQFMMVNVLIMLQT